MSESALLTLKGISKVFVTDEIETHALSEINLEINQGEFVEKARMEELHGVRRLALNAQQYVECSRACRGYRHIRLP